MPLGGPLPPLRILVAIGVTIVAVGVLGVSAVLGGEDSVQPPPELSTSTTTTGAPPTTAGEVVDTSVLVAPDWYPKRSSRYSDRQPIVTITTLPTTTTAREMQNGSSGQDRSAGR